MSVQDTDSFIQCFGNNSTEVAYTVPFLFFDDGDLVVIIKNETGEEITLALNTDYAVVGAGSEQGGSIKTVEPIPTTSKVTIVRRVDARQLTKYAENADFPAASHERALDKLTMRDQQMARTLNKSFRVRESDGHPEDGTLDELTAMPTTVIGFNGSAQPQTYTPETLRTFLSLPGGGNIVIGQPTVTFADAGERDSAVAAFPGQVGTQRDTGQIYIGSSLSNGVLQGTWTQYIRATRPFANMSERTAAVPDFVGQLGLQIDTETVYYATGASAGNWSIIQAASPIIANDSVTLAKLAAGAKNFRTGTNGLLIFRTTTSSITIDLDETVLTDGAGGFLRFAWPSTISVILSSPGAGGLDTGSEAGNTWYHVYLISNGTDLKGLFSTNATTPNLLPSGYTYYQHVGTIRNDSSSNLVQTNYYGKRAEVMPLAAASGFSYATPTNIGLSNFIPPNVRRLRGIVWASTGAYDRGFSICSNLSTEGQQMFAARCCSSVVRATYIPRTFSQAFEIPMFNTQIVQLVTGPQTYNLEITGWDIE